MILLIVPKAIFVPIAHRSVCNKYSFIHTDLEVAVCFMVYVFLHFFIVVVIAKSDYS